MKILFAASECAPFVKTGGLADFIGSLPRYLKDRGNDARVVLPNYADISPGFKENMKEIDAFRVPLGWRNQSCEVKKLKYKNVIYYFIDNKHYFDRPGLYGHKDEAERFAFFSRAVLEMLPLIDFKPDVLHCNDWQTALISLFLDSFYQDDSFYKEFNTIFTIHNLKYQGVFPSQIFEDILGLEQSYFNKSGLEFHGQVNFMKAGLNYSDIITTVSKTYAREIQTPFYGEGLDGLLRERNEDLYGIVNGIDYDLYNPLKDPHIFVNYRSAKKKKQENKIKLQEMLDLPVDKNIPMIIIISRLVKHKGFDLVNDILEQILGMEIQLVVLGTGEYSYEQMFKEASWHNPDKVSTHITFNEDLAHKMYAAGDFILMPSQYEPCGTGQLIGLRYFTVPIVRETGGLVDTVQNFNKETEVGNGFTFSKFNAYNMYDCIKRAINAYQNQKIWKVIRNNIKNCNYSWEKSAEKYIDLYQMEKSMIEY